MKSFYRCAFSTVALLAILTTVVPVRAELISAVATQGTTQFLLNWDSSDPGNILSSKPIFNASSGILGLDMRPATQELYAISESTGPSGRYLISTLSPFPNFWAVGEIGFTAEGINGFSHGFDFNPMIDRIRLVTDTNKNYVLNPSNGTVQTVATNLAFGVGDVNFGKDPNIGGSAYTNNFVGAPSTQLYGIDTGLDILVTQANNAGTLGTVGSLGLDVSSLVGFDISGATGIAYAVMTPAGASQSSFYSINLATGAATSLGVIGGGVVVTAMTVSTYIPEPSTVAMATVALIGFVAARRRSC